MYAITNAAKKKKSRQSEIALLEKISTSLDTYIGDNPVSSTPKQKKPLASDKSKNAAKNFLAAKTLVKSIAKACAQEKIVVTADATEVKHEALLKSLVAEYHEKYPSLTKEMLVSAMVRYNALAVNAVQDQDEKASSEGDSEAEGEEDAKEDDSHEVKLTRIIPAVAEEMNKYHDKIEALKKSREVAAAAAAAASDSEEETPKKGRKRKSRAKGGVPKKPKVPKQKKEPKAKIDKNSPEAFLFNEIVKKYAAQREKHEKLPNGLLEIIVEEAKREHKMEHFDMPIDKLDKKIRFRYNQMQTKEGKISTQSKHKAIVEEVYQRYLRTKEANGGKLPAGTMDAIIEGVKLEYGLGEVKLSSLKTRCQARFTKENPEESSKSRSPGVIYIRELGTDEKRRRQHLLNEITARYVSEKEAHPKKMADGTLDRIIEQVKTDTGITEFEVAKASIRGRINRKSLIVQTLGKDSPYNAIDEPLVTTINSWLSQGISVTRAQGLDLANRLLKGKQLDKVDGEEIVLDAKWWRNFLERNKRKLVCSGD